MATKFTPNPDTYCVLPHISLAVQNDGDMCVCNLNSQSLQHNKTKEVLMIHKHGLGDAWNSFTRKMIAAGLDHGKRVSSCSHCWDAEDRGQLSPRLRYNELFKDVEPSPTQPKVLIIKPGNVCNLGCRMCLPETSTSLYQDFYELDTKRGEFSGDIKLYTKNFENIREGFGADNKLIWDVLDGWWQDFHFVDLYGGEPMLTPAFWNNVQKAIDNNNINGVSLGMHTNCMVWNEKYINALKLFKKVKIGLSVDSHIPEHLEYIRHKSNYAKIFENVQKYVELTKEYPHISINFVVTVSAYNAWYVEEALEKLAEYNIPAVLNYVSKPNHYDIRHLPIPAKKLLIEKTKNQSLKSTLSQTIPGCDIEWPKFCQELEILDGIRKQSFANTFPEWYEILKPHLTSER